MTDAYTARVNDPGSKITFKPDPLIFETTSFSFDILSQRLRELAFLNRGIHIGRAGKRCTRQQIASCGVNDVSVFRSSGSLPRAVHVILELGDLGGYRTAHGLLLGLSRKIAETSGTAVLEESS